MPPLRCPQHLPTALTKDLSKQRDPIGFPNTLLATSCDEIILQTMLLIVLSSHRFESSPRYPSTKHHVKHRQKNCSRSILTTAKLLGGLQGLFVQPLQLFSRRILRDLSVPYGRPLAAHIGTTKNKITAVRTALVLNQREGVYQVKHLRASRILLKTGSRGLSFRLSHKTL